MTETMMREAAISFPMFGDFSINPKAYFTIFGRDIYWYGVILAAAFLIAMIYMARRAKTFGLTSDNVYDEVLWLIPFGLIGCRLYFVLFQWDYYSQHLSEIIRIWDGGIAIYGGIIAGVIVLVFWSRHKKIPFGAILDLDALGLILAQAIGRWGNFMNREAFGGETDIFCRMGLTTPGGETFYVHPTFLYESLWNFAGFLFLHFWSKKPGNRKYDGQLFLMYVAWYGLGRAWVEGLRTDSLWLIPGVIRVSQLVAIVSALAVIAVLIIKARRPQPPEKMYVNRVTNSPAAEPNGDAAGENKSNNESADNPTRKE